MQYARLGGDELSAVISFHGGLDGVTNVVANYCPTRIAVYNGHADFLIPEQNVSPKKFFLSFLFSISEILELEEALEFSNTYWEFTVTIFIFES